MNDEAPRQISDKEINLDITGYLMPMYANGQPVALSMPGTDDVFVGLWEHEEDLAVAMEGISYDKLVEVREMGPFLQSLSGYFRVAVNLRKLPDGKIRFTEIKNAASFAFTGRAPS